MTDTTPTQDTLPGPGTPPVDTALEGLAAELTTDLDGTLVLPGDLRGDPDPLLDTAYILGAEFT